MRWFLVALTACNGKGDDSAAPSGDADTDTDVDTDTDTDTDTDADADDWTSIDGALTYELRVEGEPVCDATIELTGDAYAGFCPECDFLFEVTGTVVRDGGNGACPFLGPLSIYDNTILYDDPILIGFASEIWYGGPYYDAFMAGGANLRDGRIYVRPITGGPELDYGTATVTGNSFAWTFSKTKVNPGWEYMLYPYYYALCRVPVDSDAITPYAPGNRTYESLACEYAQADVFSFRGVEDGTAYITVDSDGDDPPLSLGILLYGPEQCVETFASDNFACANGKSNCPSLSVDTVAGQYLVVVEQLYGCADAPGTVVDYWLDVDAAWDPEVSQVSDDVSNEKRPATLEITGTATLK